VWNEMMKINSLLLITGNAGKLEEFKMLLNIPGFKMNYKSLDVPEIQSLDIGEIGHFKTNAVFECVQEINDYDAVITDDTSLSCMILNGLPGPLIKWFLKAIGREGILDLVKNKDNTTTATCLLTLGLLNNREILQFQGDVKGQLVSPQGNSGFGWDQIFLPDGFNKTYGEMDPDQKNAISHRAIAVQKFREWLLN